MTTFSNKQSFSESLHARIPQAVLEDIDRLAISTGRSRNWLLNEALKQYLESQSWQIDIINERLIDAESKNSKFISHSEVMNRQRKRLTRKIRI